jgi:hypothetical protein
VLQTVDVASIVQPRDQFADVVASASVTMEAVEAWRERSLSGAAGVMAIRKSV